MTITERYAAHASPNGTGPEDGVPVDNPATGEVIAHIPALGDEEVKALVARAREAQRGWGELGFDARAKCFRRLQGWVVENRQRLIDQLIEENGKTFEDALVNEIVYLGEATAFWARHAKDYLKDERVPSGSPLLFGRKLIRRYVPHGVVGIIAPWNYPLNLGLGDAWTALAAGNTVVIKPSELTSLSTLLVVEEGMPECGFPEDVTLVATGRGAEAGNALVENVDMLMFTGSTDVGKMIAQRCAERLIPFAGELGGKDPMIVTRDADLERAANVAAYWGLSNSGQTCVSVERVYVEEAVYDEFVEKVRAKVAAMRQGTPGRPGSVDVGAMTNPEQLDVVEQHVEDAREKGARILTGGHRHDEGGGRFFEPTLIADADHSMEAMTVETFGPTLPIMRVRDTEEALRLANDTPYGLNACVFAGSAEEGERIARRLEAGNVGVNDTLTSYFALGAPFGGWKESGIGGRHGADGIRKFCETQTLCINRFPLKRELFHFPNRGWEGRALDLYMGTWYWRGRRALRRYRSGSD